MRILRFCFPEGFSISICYASGGPSLPSRNYLHKTLPPRSDVFDSIIFSSYPSASRRKWPLHIIWGRHEQNGPFSREIIPLSRRDTTGMGAPNVCWFPTAVKSAGKIAVNSPSLVWILALYALRKGELPTLPAAQRKRDNVVTYQQMFHPIPSHPHYCCGGWTLVTFNVGWGFYLVPRQGKTGWKSHSRFNSFQHQYINAVSWMFGGCIGRFVIWVWTFHRRPGRWASQYENAHYRNDNKLPFYHKGTFRRH